MRFAYPRVFSVVLLCALFSVAQSQTSCPGFPNMKEAKRTGLTIGTYLHGLLEYTPAGYVRGGAPRYPLIIYFHGAGEVGSGSASDLCSILTLLTPPNDNNTNDVPLPERIERGELPTVTNNSTNYNYIVLSPQYNQYNYPSAYPSAADVSAMIDYALANYDVDPGRIYLTGMSSGANMVMEYAATSEANSRRIAGIVMASLCSSVGQFPNGPRNIARANLPVWEIHCATDGVCADSISTNWINLINAQTPPPAVLAKKTTLPIAGFPCSSFTHNTWNTVYDPNFVVDGKNVYNWFIQFSRLGAGALPAGIKNYNAVLRGGKVYVEWTTTAESNTDRFILERSNGSSGYQEITAVAAAGTSNTDKKYVLIDEQPSKGNNLYRLVLVNKDNQREYYEVKRVSLPNSGGYVNIPSPVRGSLLMYVNVERSQNVRISLHDLNGKILYRGNRLFTPGVSENRLDVTGFASGTYLVKVEGENFTVTRKVVVN